jgi:hypothetical protein
MRSILCAALSAGIAVGGSSSILAQSVGVDIYTDEPHYEYGYREPATRGYRNYEGRLEVPIRPANCGEFRYWNGARCVDAREVPPDVR